MLNPTGCRWENLIFPLFSWLLTRSQLLQGCVCFISKLDLLFVWGRKLLFELAETLEGFVLQAEATERSERVAQASRWRRRCWIRAEPRLTCRRRPDGLLFMKPPSMILSLKSRPAISCFSAVSAVEVKLAETNQIKIIRLFFYNVKIRNDGKC